MQNQRNTLEANNLKEILQYEKDNGYPTFKEEIAKELSDSFDIPLSEAFEVVFSSLVQSKIDKDIEWAQHMGTTFWAEEIFKHYNSLKSFA